MSFLFLPFRFFFFVFLVHCDSEISFRHIFFLSGMHSLRQFLGLFLFLHLGHYESLDVKRTLSPFSDLVFGILYDFAAERSELVWMLDSGL